MYGTEDQIILIFHEIERMVKNIYLNKNVIDTNTQKRILNPSKKQQDQALENIINDKGRTIISNVLTDYNLVIEPFELSTNCF
ncbi:MAG: hypothetical protein ACRCTQ_02810 [Brevinemataceae bacterium]